MKLLYAHSTQPVRIGDIVIVDRSRLRVCHFLPPHKAQEGKVTLTEGIRRSSARTVAVSRIGAQWTP